MIFKALAYPTPSSGKFPERNEWLIHGVSVITLFVATTLFYTSQFTIHQDLAGSALSGALFINLGSSYETYHLYFPPAEKIWFSLGAWISAESGLQLDVVMVLMTCLVISISAEFAYLIRKTTVGASPIFLVISIIVLTLLPIVFKNVFGLREHLIVLGLWPYLVLRVSDPKDDKIHPRLRMWLGFWMGLTLLIRFHYAVVVLLVEICDAILQHRFTVLFRPENLIAGTIVLVYVLTWLGLQPANRDAIVVMKNAIDANLISWTGGLINVFIYILRGLAFLIIAIILNVLNRNIAIGVAAFFGAILSAWIQHRWYSHHEFPINMVLIYFLWISYAKFPKYITFFTFLLFSIPFYQEYIKIKTYQSSASELENSLYKNDVHFKNKKISIFNLHPSPFNQIIAKQNGLRWTPLMNLAYVPAEVQFLDTIENKGTFVPPISFSGSPPRNSRSILHHKLMLFLESHPPEVIILDHSQDWPLRHLRINWRHMLSQDPRFQKIIDDFELKFTHSGEFLQYEYYIRKK